MEGLSTKRLGKKGRAFSLRSSCIGSNHELAPRSDLGPVLDGEGDQLVERFLARQERHLEERRLDRLQQRARFKQEDLRQRALVTRQSRIACCCSCAQTLKFCPGPVDLQWRDQAGGKTLGQVHEQLSPLERRTQAEQPAARLLHVEVRLGDAEQDIIASRLKISLPRGHHPPRCQWCEDGIGEPDVQERPSADKEALTVLTKVWSREDILLDTVMSEVVNAAVEVGNPEHLGLEIESK